MQCIQTEVEQNLPEKIAEPLQGESQRALRRRKSRNSVGWFASAVGLGAIAGFVWLYLYAVSALQTALSVFEP